MANSKEYELVKKGHVLSEYTQKQLNELDLCTDSPLYFIENFIKVQHPIKGSVPLELYDYQRDMVNAYHSQRFCVALTARQMGKCLTPTTSITHNGANTTFKSIFSGVLTCKDRIVEYLEHLLIKLVK